MRKIITLLILVFVSGCASYRLDEAQHDLRSSFARHNFDKTVALLEKYNRKDIYRSKDDVLYNLEMATATHFSGQYETSSNHFSKAEDEIDALFTKSISRGVASFLFSNDNSLAYNGEAYEDIYLNAFNSLNYIHRGDLEGALVEARRMSYKLSRIEAKYQGVAEALSKADTLGRGDWKTGSASVQNSALSHYLSSVLYAKSDKPDDARIEYEKMLQAMNEQSVVNKYSVNGTKLQQKKMALPTMYWSSVFQAVHPPSIRMMCASTSTIPTSISNFRCRSSGSTPAALRMLRPS